MEVHAGGRDGDGLHGDVFLRLTGADGKLTSASYAVAPHDGASGAATGKRQHGSITLVKEWGAATAELQKMKPQYDVNTLKENERAARLDQSDPVERRRGVRGDSGPRGNDRQVDVEHHQ